MANVKYPKFREAALKADCDLDGTVKAQLVTSGYVYSAAHEFLSSVAAGNRLGTAVTLTGKTFSSGVFDCDDPLFQSVPQGAAAAVVVYLDTGNEATSRLIAYYDGKITVTCAADAAGAAEALKVDPLEAALPNGGTLVFSGGVTATLTAEAAAGARTLSVAALSDAVAAGETAPAVTKNAGLPATIPSGGGDLSLAIDAGAHRLFAL